MAIPVARVHLAMAHAALPALLPTPPKSKMLPLLPTPPCIATILLPTSPPKPSRADAAERWDARKNAIAPPSKPGRADAIERWDARKVRPPCPASSVSSQRSSDSDSKSSRHRGRASSSSERWDANKKSSLPPPPPSSSTSSPVSRAPCSAAALRGSHTRAISSKPSPERWDAHKKQPRPAPSEELDDSASASSTGSNESMELDMPRRQQRAPYAGPGFLVAAPEPSMLPMPSSFMVRVTA